MGMHVRKTVQCIGLLTRKSMSALGPRTNPKAVLSFLPKTSKQTHHFSTAFDNIMNTTEEGWNSRLLESWSCGVEHFGKLKMNLPFDTRVKCLDPQLYPEMNKVIIRMIYTAPEIPAREDLHEYLAGFLKMYELNIDTHNNVRPDEIIVKGRLKGVKQPIACLCEIPLKFDLDINCSGDTTVIDGMENDSIAVTAKSCTFINTKSGTISAECSDGDLVCQKLLQGNLHLQAKGKSNICTDRLQGAEIRCSTESGNITASSVYGNQAHFTSSHGDIKLTNCHANSHIEVSRGNLTIDSFEGSLHADVKKGTTDIFITRPEQIKVESETGDICIRVDRTINSSFELQGKSVNVDKELEFKEESSSEFNGQELVKGHVNENLASISVETAKGSVHLKQQTWFQSLNLKFSV